MNTSFENITNCPTFYGTIDSTLDWKSYRNSSDYFNSTCGFAPSNFFGVQNASDGVAYCGIYVKTESFTPNYREFIGQQLPFALDSGQCYKISFKVSLADQSNYSIDKLGAILTMQAYSPLGMPNFAHVIIDTFLIDKTIWFQASGTFIAERPYTNIVLGNFFNDEQTDSVYVGGGHVNNFSYYYLDEILLEKDTLSLSCPCKNPVSSFLETSTGGTKFEFDNYTTTTLDFTWDFGDGNTSTEVNPIHNYDTSGSYNVCLISQNLCGADTTCKLINVTCDSSIADLFFFQTDSLVSFFNMSTYADSLIWDFGDGDTSTLNSVDHIYLTSGTFEACLRIYNFCLETEDSICQTITNVLTDISNQTATSSFRIYPNPARAKFFVDFRGSKEKALNATIILYDVAGKQVSQNPNTTASDLLEVDISKLEQGLYVGVLYAGSDVIGNIKVLKE